MSMALKNGKSQIPSWFKSNPHWNSALYILESLVKRNSKFLALTQAYVNIEESTISFTEMKKAASLWPMGERLMIDLAAHLFNEEDYDFYLSDLELLDSKLDSQFRKIAIEGIKKRFNI